MGSMCDSCQAKWDGWTNHQAPATRWLQYPISATRSIEARSAQLTERAALADWQCRMIRKICLANH